MVSREDDNGIVFTTGTLQCIQHDTDRIIGDFCGIHKVGHVLPILLRVRYGHRRLHVIRIHKIIGRFGIPPVSIDKSHGHKKRFVFLIIQQIVSRMSTGGGVSENKLRVVAVLVKPVVISQHGRLWRLVLNTEQAGMVALISEEI